MAFSIPEGYRIYSLFLFTHHICIASNRLWNLSCEWDLQEVGFGKAGGMNFMKPDLVI